MQVPEPEDVTSEHCRNTPWRQGHVLPESVAAGLALDPKYRYLIISHDCDLAQPVDVEPHVEVIEAEVLDAADPMCMLAQNPRVLHLDVLVEDGALRQLQLMATAKALVDKAALFSIRCDVPPRLPDNERRILQSWLACRYRRHALPNALNDRLNKAYGKLKEVAKKKPEGVIATWIKYDPDAELNAGEDYEVSFVVVHQSETPDGSANAAAMVDKLDTALKSAEGIDYRGAKAEADSTFTKFAERQMWEWRLEFVSFRSDPPGPLSEPG